MKRTSKPRILSVSDKRILDDSPDTSYLGEYSSQPGPDERTIDREAEGDSGQKRVPLLRGRYVGRGYGNPESSKARLQSHGKN